MKTLFATVWPAFPPISGADLRTWQSAKAASELGPVLLASTVRPQPEVPPPGVEIRHICGWKNSDFELIFSPDAIEQFKALCSDFRPDVIILESLHLINLLAVARQSTKTLIIDMHNVESDLVAQDAEGELDSEVIRAIAKLTERIRALEQSAIFRADRTWVCSSDDRDRLVKHGADATRIEIIPNGIPFPESIQFRPQIKGRCRQPKILFIGHLHYQPNIDAALWLVDLVPEIWKRIPDAQMIVAGRNPHPALLSKAQPGKITVVADPVSTSVLIQSATVTAIPLQRGGGTRIKILEALAWGLPVVAMARAAEGLQLQDGVHLRIAETAVEFVTAICDLCTDPESFESQRQAARQHVMANFGPDVIAARIQKALQFR
jgi:glycosyltransferase involved in cell wall biosynthesis